MQTLGPTVAEDVCPQHPLPWPCGTQPPFPTLWQEESPPPLATLSKKESVVIPTTSTQSPK